MTSLARRSLGEIVTGSRASVGNYFTAAGALASAAVNQPRVDYDPATLLSRGLLLEEQRTNLLLNSTALSTQSVTVTAVAHTLTFYGTGSVTLSGAASGSLNGTGVWTRRTLTFTPTAGSLTLTVAGAVNLAQLEVGAYSTSYITTAGATATRSRDTFAIGSVAQWLEEGVGTLAIDFMMPFQPTADGVLRRLVQLDDGTENNRICLYLNGPSLIMDVTAGGAGQVSNVLKNISNSVSQRAAFAWSTNDCAGAADTGSLATDTSGTMPTGLTTARVGCAVATGSELSGLIRRLRYYPRRVSNNDLRALAA